MKRKIKLLPFDSTYGARTADAPTLCEPWYTDSKNFWKFRAIFHASGLDYVPDRGGFGEGQSTPERLAFVKQVLESSAFANWVKAQWGNSDEVFFVDCRNLHLRATNNRSYGYTYLWAWDDSTESNGDMKT